MNPTPTVVSGGGQDIEAEIARIRAELENVYFRGIALASPALVERIRKLDEALVEHIFKG